MAVKQVLVKKGQVITEEIPAPQIEPGTILVDVKFSCISTGTEINNVKLTDMPLWKRALKQPHNAKKALKMMATSGVLRTRRIIKGMLDNGTPSGYSCAGTVLAVAPGIDDIKINDAVACAGAQCAYHADIVRVPHNLTTKIPHGVDYNEAATVTIGSIALQGVRRANPTLGETFAVIGLGVLGQITTQILKNNGVRVIGMDLDPERVMLAKKLGMPDSCSLQNEQDIAKIYRLTDGIGVDGVIITAAGSSNKIVAQAFQMSRKKGRVVLVGDVGLHLNRADFYAKEIDFLISCSYGPGRYDEIYEEQGLDYPIAYVRWTENRNMQAYLKLIAEKRIDINSLISKTYPIEQAAKAFNDINSSEKKPLITLLSYATNNDGKIVSKVTINQHKKLAKNKINLCIVGAGNFAKAVHLPNLEKLTKLFQIHSVVSRAGHNALSIAKQYHAKYASTNFEEAVADPNIDVLLITTRHNLHANMTLTALKAGKHVLVEKPLAITQQELTQIENFFSTEDNTPILLTGFNRRFSPIMQKIKSIITPRTSPMIINYCMNAGYLPKDHWVHGKEGGGRNIGEACHIYDLFTFLTESIFTNIQTEHINPNTEYYFANDNFNVSIKFSDGSIANLTYTALGNKNYPKETMQIFVDGKVISMRDYKSLQITETKTQKFNRPISDKGQFQELKSFANAILKQKNWPIPLWQQIQATHIALIVEQHLTGISTCAA